MDDTSSIVSFIQDNELVNIDFSRDKTLNPTTTVLQYLRSDNDHKGVKEGCSGFYGNQLRTEGKEFDLVERVHSVSGKTITADMQFSEKWMEKLEEPKKRGPKPKVPE